VRNIGAYVALKREHGLKAILWGFRNEFQITDFILWRCFESGPPLGGGVGGFRRWWRYLCTRGMRLPRCFASHNDKSE